MKSSYKEFKDDISIFIIAVVILNFLFNYFNVNFDSTDNPDGKRSNLSLHIDHRTGCHYLSSQGGLVKRVDSNGHHICSGD